MDIKHLTFVVCIIYPATENQL